MSEKNKDVQCPVCGYYCTGKGGYGCIDKPAIVFPGRACGTSGKRTVWQNKQGDK